MGDPDLAGADNADPALERHGCAPGLIIVRSDCQLGNVSIQGAKGLLVNISGKKRCVTMHEVRDAMSYIYSVVSPDAKVFGGLGAEDTLEDSIRITVIATGIPQQTREPSFQKDRKFQFGQRLIESPANGEPQAKEAQDGEASEDDSLGIPDLRKPAYLRRRSVKFQYPANPENLAS